MFEMNIPGDLQGPGGVPDIRKLLQFVRDEISAQSNSNKRGIFSKPLPPRYPHFGLAEAFDVLGDEDYFRHTCWVELASLLSENLYEGMLKRPADPVGRANLAIRIATDKSLVSAMKLVSSSAEYRQKNMASQPPISGLAGVVEQAVRISARYGKNDLSLQSLAEILGSELELGRLHRQLLASNPIDWSTKKVLLFGAFGNGNMGDAYQALAMREHVHRSMGVPLDHIFACSVLNQFDYPFPDTHKRPPESILNTDALNQFGMLVIGGGGLLAHPHAPLLSADWVSRLTVPVALVGVGASGALADQFGPLARLAVAVSGRDDWSVKAFASCGLIAEKVPDASASISAPTSLMAFDAPLSPAVEAALQLEGVQPYDWLWVVKHPSNADEQMLLDTVRQYIDSHKALSHGVVAIEPQLDSVLQDQFPEVKLVSTLSRLWALIQRSQRVCTMRFHGGIFALMQRKPVVGCAQAKLKFLAQDWGADLSYADAAGALPDRLNVCSSAEGAGLPIEAMCSAMDQFLGRFGQHG